MPARKKAEKKAARPAAKKKTQDRASAPRAVKKKVTKPAPKPARKPAAKSTPAQPKKKAAAPASKAKARPRTASTAKQSKRTKPSARKAPRKATRVHRPLARPLATEVAVGDAIRIPGGTGGVDMEGIVCGIRDVAAGKHVAKTTRELAAYVLEVVHDQTFRAHFASDHNSGGPRGLEDIRQNPVWRRLRAELKALAAHKQFVSLASGATTPEAVRSLLDGWRIVRTKAAGVELME